jgi:shikimate kinase/3-dehydroquinate synthase
METQYTERIILTGPPGSGKSAVAAALAAALAWSLVDTDAAIEAQTGRRIGDIFATLGEAHFRDLERGALAGALARHHVVIATGGGIGEDEANRRALRAGGWVIGLQVRPETALARLRAEADASGTAVGALRPLLAGGDPLERLRALQARRPWYADADMLLQTDKHTPQALAQRALAGLVARGLLPPCGAEPAVHTIQPAGEPAYAAVVAWGALATLGARLAALGLPRRLHVVSDDTVAPLFAEDVVAGLARAGFTAEVFLVPAGEASKSREQLAALHDWLAERRVERGEAVIALGGGVVGDLAGFAAATYLRGVPLVQVPTSLLAQVDASIGGKVAIDHPRGKNLLGAFYQPRLVLTDPAVLVTLPDRLRREGWAEVIKHGVALDAEYAELLEEQADALLRLEPAATTAAIARSVALKGTLVERDPREAEGGRRHLLNYGHTMGHAIERVTGYRTWLHGEAVAAGMSMAARLGQRLGLTPARVVERQERLLRQFGLPVRLDGLSAGALLRAALWDKKVRGGRVRWVLLNDLGQSALHANVPEDDVRAVLLELGATDTTEEAGLD